MQTEKVSAIILNYNSGSDSIKCIGFLLKQDYNNLDIIVVDNHSSDKEDCLKLQKYCDENKIQFISNKDNLGYSAGNNIGLRAAIKDKADWCLIINPDVEIRDNTYISYVMKRKNDFQNVGAIGTNILNPDRSRQNPSRNLKLSEEILFPIEVIKQKLGIWDGYLMEDKTGYCEKIHGCCLFLNRDFLLKADFLDESVFLYCEEPIQSKQIKKMKYNTLYIKEVTANHEHYRNQKAGSSGSRMKMFLKSRTYYINKYSEYSALGKKFAILSRKLQSKLWGE